MKNEEENFKYEVLQNIVGLGEDIETQQLGLSILEKMGEHRYPYNFRWLSRPIIQIPQDIVAIQELIWSIKPDLIIETGVAHGGSLILSASMLAMLDMEDGIRKGGFINPRMSDRMVLGVDIDIWDHNRIAIEEHPMASRIKMIQGSSIDPAIVDEVRKIAIDYSNVMVILDSNHTHEHVLAELDAYASLVTVDSYCCVFDTLIDDMPAETFSDRPWGPGNNPKTAVREYIKHHPEFEVDKNIDHKLLISVAPEGYLKRIK